MWRREYVWRRIYIHEIEIAHDEHLLRFFFSCSNFTSTSHSKWFFSMIYLRSLSSHWVFLFWENVHSKSSNFINIALWRYHGFVNSHYRQAAHRYSDLLIIKTFTSPSQLFTVIRFWGTLFSLSPANKFEWIFVHFCSVSRAWFQSTFHGRRSNCDSFYDSDEITHWDLRKPILSWK